MKITATQTEIEAALNVANEQFENNLRFKRLDPCGKHFTVTLTVNSSKKPGARISYSGRRIAAACWHAHKAFMQALFRRNPAARIQTCHADYKGQQSFLDQFEDTGWKNIGSMMSPMNFRDACEC